MVVVNCLDGDGDILNRRPVTTIVSSHFNLIHVVTGGVGRQFEIRRGVERQDAIRTECKLPRVCSACDGIGHRFSRQVGVSRHDRANSGGVFEGLPGRGRDEERAVVG